ncbi:cobyric acid synthase [Kroppenstedtia eburnea]|uniref:Cobyric acid synthase n=1 Tax=Kroppenstedtia eburnea TaxID=714067 RepID=A0A1N7MJT6_9BACL|nr:cobyric acid synthase [Kroppenstedtia eburnea]QKI81610.1 cobyric acid synthase [Kroppenstedtia eburnea]SIS86211.1 adenosylcobyric acid synthase (glutamine-hydrolysing) [Kroppenstedtia eburnea]
MKKCLMLQGTGSDVGKSVLATAFCRIFRREGHRVLPFKSQNMALNSYVTPDGGEIGRAQGVQAEACGVDATVDMNPILIKPSGERHSQIILRGKPHSHMDAFDFRGEFHRHAWEIVTQSYRRLEQEADLIVIEGAGSPVEVNLKEREIVNMRVARWLEAPVILVADIDRGGVFAQLVGTMELLEPEERELVAGFLINKFRGDPSLMDSGIRWLEERTGKPVLGLIPWLPDLGIEAEDSVALQHRTRREEGEGEILRIAVIRHPRIANFTDVDALEREPDVHLDYVDGTDSLGSADVIILPDSKNVMEDWLHWERRGLPAALRHRMEQGARVVGICGGYQMMGQSIASTCRRHRGLDLFPVTTTYSSEKRAARVKGVVTAVEGLPDRLAGLPVEGYEIHRGVTRPISGSRNRPFLRVGAGESLRDEGQITPDGRHWGTDLHGIFDNDQFRREWLNDIRREKGWPPVEGAIPYRKLREAALDRLADHVQTHTDMDRLYRVLGWTDGPR